MKKLIVMMCACAALAVGCTTKTRSIELAGMYANYAVDKERFGLA